MKKRTMKHFYVMTIDFNTDEIEQYDVIPHLVEEYGKLRKKDIPQTEQAFREFIRKEAQYQWWSRAEYEIIVSPLIEKRDGSPHHKIDVFYQIEMNLNIVCQLVADSITKLPWRDAKPN